MRARPGDGSQLLRFGGRLAVVAAAWRVAPAAAQFGGGYTPPPPLCPAFSCPKGQRAAGKAEYQIWSYGCKDSGINVMSGLNFDPRNPTAGMQQKNLDKCCIEKDICKQTCGMSSKACHESFQKCSTKICKGDQNCQLQAMMADIMAEPLDDREPTDKKYDPEETKCRAYNKWQSEACACVPDADFKGATQSKLQQFYSKFNPEKLDSKGEIKDVGEVWKKWSGKEADMFLALATKYKDKAVERREKPKPPPYKPPAAEEASSKDAAGDAEEDAKDVGQKEVEESEYDSKRKTLEARKQQAKDDEDYDLAETVSHELDALRQEELQALKAKKNKAIEEEDYLTAKELKARIAKIEL